MASPCEIRLGAPAPEPIRRVAARQATAEVHRIEQACSRYRADSTVSRINAAAGTGRRVPVDQETAGLIGYAATLFDASDGRFDINSGVLRRAWDFRGGNLPPPALLASCLSRVGWDKIDWQGDAIGLPLAGVEIDLGDIGKECAADRAASILQAQGYRHGYVNLGGDIRTLGPRPDGRDWQFGIRHPRDATGVLARVGVGAGALATSGGYDRYLIHDGLRYCHILNARTGWSVRHWQSVSEVAPACLAAGAPCTVAMPLGATAVAFLRDEGVTFLAIEAEGRRLTQAIDASSA